MQAIFTKILPATNTKPTRVKAYCPQGSATLSYEYGQSNHDNHRTACAELIAKLEWCPRGWASGDTETGYVWVYCP